MVASGRVEINSHQLVHLNSALARAHKDDKEEGLRLRAGWADTQQADKTEVTASTDESQIQKVRVAWPLSEHACFKVSKEWNDR